jgi:uncharacterized membrane protein
VKLLVMPHAGLVMPDTPESYSYASFYSDLIPEPGDGALGLITSVITNPAFVLGHALSGPKQLFLAVMFFPTLGLCCLAGWGRVMLVYGLAFTLLSTRPALHSIGFHYVAVLFPFTLVLIPQALASLQRQAPFGLDAVRLVPAVLVSVLVASALISFKFGAILPNSAFRSGYESMARPPAAEAERAYAAVMRALAQIPGDASVAVGDRIAPHASNRPHVEHFFRDTRAEYILVEPTFLLPSERARFETLRGSPGYSTSLDSEGVVLLRRGSP